QAFIAAHAGEKPLHLSLGLSKEQLKDLPKDMQEFAKSLEDVHTAQQSIAGADIFGKLDAQIGQAKTKVDDLKDSIAHPATVATFDPATGQQTGEATEDTSRYQKELAAATEYYNALSNLKNTQHSRSSAEDNAVARDQITNSKDAAQRVAEAAKQQEE